MTSPLTLADCESCEGIHPQEPSSLQGYESCFCAHLESHNQLFLCLVCCCLAGRLSHALSQYTVEDDGHGTAPGVQVVPVEHSIHSCSFPQRLWAVSSGQQQSGGCAKAGSVVYYLGWQLYFGRLGRHADSPGYQCCKPKRTHK